MIILLWILIILMGLLVLVLLLPIEIEIDTQANIYRAGWHGVFGCRTLPDEEGRWRFFFQIFFFEKEWHPSKKKKEKAKPPTVEKKQKQKASFSPGQGWQLFRRMVAAVKVKRLSINWDTDDFVRNAWLYPLFRLLSKDRRRLAINFNGSQQLVLLVQARPYRLAGAFLKTIVLPKIFKP